jgi:DNA primase
LSIPEATLDEIRARTDLVALVGADVELRTAGGDAKACCPLHNERTPSFHVHAERRFWKCFGCGESGDCFSWLVKMHGLTFPEAVRRLADAAGVPIPESGAPEPPEAKAERKRARDRAADRRRWLVRLHDLAAAHWNDQLAQDAGAEALAYLTARGLTHETIATWRLGWAPPEPHLVRHVRERMRAKGTADAETLRAVERAMLAAGLVGESKCGARYERFRGRVTIPVRNADGETVAIAARAIDPASPRKYVNSPETDVFKKGELLFGLHEARPLLRRGAAAVVVEGQLDAIALHQTGEAAVASMGTAFGEAHARLLARYADRTIVWMDPDEAGRKAAATTHRLLAAAGVRVLSTAAAPQASQPTVASPQAS